MSEAHEPVSHRERIARRERFRGFILVVVAAFGTFLARLAAPPGTNVLACGIVASSFVLLLSAAFVIGKANGRVRH